jgi:hypothetical protein
LKAEALDRTLWTTRFERGSGPLVRQTKYSINVWFPGPISAVGEEENFCPCQESKSHFPVLRLCVARLNKLLTPHRGTEVEVTPRSGSRLNPAQRYRSWSNATFRFLSLVIRFLGGILPGITRRFGMSDLRSTTHWRLFFSINGIYSKLRKLLTLYYVVFC